jgi:hypothetical protein
MKRQNTIKVLAHFSPSLSHHPKSNPPSYPNLISEIFIKPDKNRHYKTQTTTRQTSVISRSTNHNVQAHP